MTPVVGGTVYLRHLAARDRDEFLERVRASRKLHGDTGVAPANVEAFAAWLKRTKGSDMESLLVCRRDDGAIAGVYNISQIFYGHFRSAYLGYGLRAVRRGRGPLGLHRLEANIQPENAPSIALVAGAASPGGLSPRS